MKNALLVFSILILGISAHAFGDSIPNIKSDPSPKIELPTSIPDRSSSSTENCLSLDNTSDIFICLDAAYRLEDEKLNKTYARLVWLLKRKEPARLDSMKKAELLWINLRDADCAFDSSADGLGEATSAALQICVIHETFHRRRKLESKLFELQQRIILNKE